MEVEVESKLGAQKSEQTDSRSGYCCGYRSRSVDTHLGTMYLLVPQIRKGSYIPVFFTGLQTFRFRFVSLVQEAYVHGVRTKKIEHLAKSLGIENLSRSQVSEMTKGLNEQVEDFGQRNLSEKVYQVLRADVLYEKVRFYGLVLSEAAIVVCRVDTDEKRDILAV